jgi:hypothetical protein
MIQHRTCEGSGNHTDHGGFCAMWPLCRELWESADRAPDHIRTYHVEHPDDTEAEAVAAFDYGTAAERARAREVTS